MERLFNRVRWNNLSLRAKTAAVFALQIGLIVVMAGTGFAALDSVRSAVEDTLTNVVAARALSKDLELRIENLGQLQQGLAGSYADPGFDPETAGTTVAYAGAIVDIKNKLGDLQVLRTLLRGPVPDATFNTAFADFNRNVDQSQVSIQDTFKIVRQLTTHDTGELPLLRKYGSDLQSITLRSGDPKLDAQTTLILSLEGSMIKSHADSDRAALQDAVASYSQEYKLGAVPAMQQEAQTVINRYSHQVDVVFDVLRQLDRANELAASQLATLRDLSSRLTNLIQTQTSTPLETVSGIIGQGRVLLLSGLLVALLAGSLITLAFSNNLGRSMGILVGFARQLESGNLKTRSVVRGTDEFSQLGGAFNAMAIQIDGLISGLEQRVAERTRDLSITAEIGRAIVELRDSRELMNEIVDLIRTRFGFYHAQIFLLDDSHEKAVLVASTGTAGRELLSRGHFLEVGSQSVIGQVTARGTPLIASDTDASAVHKRNELLPDTRSEMALPMRIGERVIGALDVQSVAPNAFAEDVVAVFQTMADELAVGLENARIYSQLQQTEATLLAMEHRLTREAWQTYDQARPAGAPASFQINQDKIEPHRTGTPFALEEAMQAGEVITAGNGDGDVALAVPIKVRGEVIGAFGFGGDTLDNLTEDDIALVEAVVDRVGLALENIRLVEQTSRRAEHEQIVNDITAKLVGSTDVNFILQTTVKELGRVLRAPQTSVQLRRDKADDHD